MMYIHPDVKDKRGEKIIFLTHCCLNQNAKVRGIARYPGAMTPLIQFCLEEGLGMYQMPCPEMLYAGNMRWGYIKKQYDNPMFRRHAQRLADEVADMAENYIQCGYQVLGFVMMDGSPVCGLNKIPLAKRDDELWGGMARYVPEPNQGDGRGVYCGILKAELERREMGHLPFVAAPEFEEFGSVEDTMVKIRELL